MDIFHRPEKAGQDLAADVVLPAPGGAVVVVLTCAGGHRRRTAVTDVGKSCQVCGCLLRELDAIDDAIARHEAERTGEAA